jgi:hypothetical protein
MILNFKQFIENHPVGTTASKQELDNLNKRKIELIKTNKNKNPVFIKAPPAEEKPIKSRSPVYS